LVVVATENIICGQTLKVTEVDIADISGLSLSGVKGSRSPKSVRVTLPFGASKDQPNGVWSAQGGTSLYVLSATGNFNNSLNILKLIRWSTLNMWNEISTSWPLKLHRY